MLSAEIRQTFLEYFKKQGHTRVPSASLIPAGDPTLYFTNAGMVPFKDVFLGTEKRSYVRACSSQKCMRVSGKHNDLENVGLTPRHHTFFEMLGNFSFGDYFKKEAIGYAWEFLTRVVKLPEGKMVVTVFEKDDEAFRLWEGHVPKARIFRMTEKDNFWAMGETGPCGPCSEILWDFGSGPFTAADIETDRFFELWNLVFMQYNRDASGKLTPLPKPSVDTGMGLERLACVLQGKQSNWETDLFVPIIRKIEAVTGRLETEGEEVRIALRVIADHVRSACFLLADGCLPSNEGRGYVLRRILRRAIRYAKKLEVRGSVAAETASAVIAEMGEAYPELERNKTLIAQALETEEENFLKTMDRGLEILEGEFEKLRSGKKTEIPGAVVFKLYDTYGFPKDLTELIARERGFAVDEPGFDEAMEAQRERGVRAWKGSEVRKITPLLRTIYGGGDRTLFLYDRMVCEEGVLNHLLREGREVERVKEGEMFEFIAPVTPFYAEGGGQVGDTGWSSSVGGEAAVGDTQKPFSDLFLHRATVEKGELRRGERIRLAVDEERRRKIMCNHTATHLLHAALRHILGTHVKQAGSYLDERYLRFDFSHFASITEEQLADIEALVNKVIRANYKVTTAVLPYAEAVDKGALAFFGEKYGERVRVVQIGDFSVELCGGTHVSQTGDIGRIRIMKERSVASGVRRVEAVSRELAREFEVLKQEKIKQTEEIAKENAEQLQRERKEKLERIRAIFQEDLMPHVRQYHGIKVLVREVPAANAGELREIADHFRQKLGDGVVALGARIGGKAAFIVTSSPALAKKFPAGPIVKKMAAEAGGTGGGRPDMAQGGGPDAGKVADILSRIESFLLTGR